LHLAVGHVRSSAIPYLRLTMPLEFESARSDSFKKNRFNKKGSSDWTLNTSDVYVLVILSICVFWFLERKIRRRGKYNNSRYVAGGVPKEGYAEAGKGHYPNEGYAAAARGYVNVYPNEGYAASGRGHYPKEGYAVAMRGDYPNEGYGDEITCFGAFRGEEPDSPYQGHHAMQSRKSSFWPSNEVHFVVEMESQPGDRLLVVGGHESLGGWNPDRTVVELTTSKYTYPVWTGTWHANRHLQGDYPFKLVVKNKEGQEVWEDLGNRFMNVSTRPGGQTLPMKFNTRGFHHFLLEERLAGN